MTTPAGRKDSWRGAAAGPARRTNHSNPFYADHLWLPFHRCPMRRSFYNQRGANLDEISSPMGSLLHDIPHAKHNLAWVDFPVPLSNGAKQIRKTSIKADANIEKRATRLPQGAGMTFDQTWHHKPSVQLANSRTRTSQIFHVSRPTNGRDFYLSGRPLFLPEGWSVP